MSEELLINVSPMESRVAVLDNGVLGEIYIERHHKLGLVGNIYLGTVVRVLPGMQAAFVDIGQSRTAFLHVNDMQRLPRPVMSIAANAEQEQVQLATTGSDISSVSEIDTDSVADQACFDGEASLEIEDQLATDSLALKHSDKSAITTPGSLRMTPPVVSPKPIAPRRSSLAQPPKQDLIQHRLHEGQRILVQVTKDQLGTKGARLTTNITLPSRYLVYLP